MVDGSPDVKNWAGKVHHSKVSRVKPLWSSEYLSTEYYTEIGKNTEIENITKTKGQIRFHIQILSGYLKHGLFIQVGWSNIEQVGCAEDAWTTRKSIAAPVKPILCAKNSCWKIHAEIDGWCEQVVGQTPTIKTFEMYNRLLIFLKNVRRNWTCTETLKVSKCVWPFESVRL